MRSERQRFRLFCRKIRGRENRSRRKRLSLEKMQKPLEEEGGGLVVKGVSKRVIVVKSPDPKIFEQAIFIIREDFAGQRGVSDKDVLRQAREAADEYMKGFRGFSGRRLLAAVRAPLYAAAGAAATGLAWFALHMVHL